MADFYGVFWRHQARDRESWKKLGEQFYKRYAKEPGKRKEEEKKVATGDANVPLKVCTGRISERRQTKTGPRSRFVKNMGKTKRVPWKSSSDEKRVPLPSFSKSLHA